MDECDIEYPGFDDESTEPPLPAGLELRTMEPGDLQEVKRLHEQCFPVRYDMAFYENVVRGVIVRGKGQSIESLYTQVALVRLGQGTGDGKAFLDEPPRRQLSEQPGGPGGDSHEEVENPPDARARDFEDEACRYRGGNGCARRKGMSDNVAEVGDDDVGGSAEPCGNRTEREGVDNGNAGTRPEVPPSDQNALAGSNVNSNGGIVQKEKIVGLITCQVLPLERCFDRHRLGLRRSFGVDTGQNDHSEVVYILTLGTEKVYRRRGIGRALLQRCVWLSRQESTIGAVYLHVITTNPAAHRFYEAEGFTQVCCINDYYKIKGRMYDCYLYALYVNGAQPPCADEWSLGGIARGVQKRFLEVIALLWKGMGYPPDDDNQSDASCDSFEDEAEDDAGDADVEGSSPWLSPGDRLPSPLYSAAVSAAAGVGAARGGFVRQNGGGCRSGGGVGTARKPSGRAFTSPSAVGGVLHDDLDGDDRKRCRRRGPFSRVGHDRHHRDGAWFATEAHRSTAVEMLSSNPEGRSVFWNAAVSQGAWTMERMAPAVAGSAGRVHVADSASIVEVGENGSVVDVSTATNQAHGQEAAAAPSLGSGRGADAV